MGFGLKIAPVVAGTSIYLRPSQWKDENFDLLAFSATGNNPLPDPIDLDNTNIKVAGFPATQIREVSGTKEINHDAMLGGIIAPHIHWMPTTANAGNVVWRAEFYISYTNEPLVQGSFKIVSPASGVAWGNGRVNSEFGEFFNSLTEIGGQLSFRLYRDTTDLDDTYPDTVAAQTFGYHYQLDSAGSREKVIK